MRKPGRNYSPSEKVTVLKHHLIDKLAEACPRHQLASMADSVPGGAIDTHVYT